VDVARVLSLLTDPHVDVVLVGLIESKRAVRQPKELAALPHIEAVLRMREADAARDAENR